MTGKTEQQRRARRQLYDIAARQSLAWFARTQNEHYQIGWVHQQICDELDAFLEAVNRRESPRLMIAMPPRHGKSQLASRYFPAYALGRYPDLSIISTSYSADLSSAFNRDVQRIIDSDRYKRVFPGTALGTGRDAVRQSDRFEIVGHKGVYRSAGVGGGITGMGGDILLVDDAFKDRADANSQTIRKSVWDWYTSTLYTRQAPGAGIVVIGTRWHTDDLIGHLLSADRKNEGDHWRVIEFPAIAEKDEPFRKKGEALHPERYPLEALQRIKVAIGSRDWEALYQQHPVPDGGALFKADWIKRWSAATLPQSYDQLIQSWDMAFKGTDHSDFVVGQVWGRKGADFFLLDQMRGRWDFVQTLEAVKTLTQRWPKAYTKLVEEKANGAAVMAQLKSVVGGFLPIVPKESKEARAFAITPLFESGNVYLPPTEVAWVDRDYLPELLQFPAGAHDDQVDSTDQALNHLRRRSGFRIAD